MTRQLLRLLREEKGQDLIEYALLTGIIGVSAILIVPQIREKLGLAFTTTSGGLYDRPDNANWIPADPQP